MVRDGGWRLAQARRHRALFLLGWTYDDMGSLLGLSASAVRARIRRAGLQCRKEDRREKPSSEGGRSCGRAASDHPWRILAADMNERALHRRRKAVDRIVRKREAR